MKPILFNTEMVCAILGGRKTVTRRVIKPQPAGRIGHSFDRYKLWHYPSDTAYLYLGDDWRVPEGLTNEERNRHWTPPYHAGDILYVRETWADIPETAPGNYHYKASATDAELAWFKANKWKWRPSIHMPREAARIYLRVTDVRVERLQEITDEDIVAEGLQIGCYFDDLWDSTIKPADRERYGWAADPWVWVIEFERCE